MQDIAWVIIGIALSSLFFIIYQKWRLRSFHILAQDIINQAEKEAKHLRENAKIECKEMECEIAQKQQEKEKKFLQAKKEVEHSIKEREEKLQKERKHLENKKVETEKKESELSFQEKMLTHARQELNTLVEANRKKIEEIAGYSQEKARNELILQQKKEIESECDHYFALHFLEKEKATEEKAQKLLISSLHRFSEKIQWNASTTSLLLPNEEIKAKIIGKEGRNIRTFEQVTGVTLLMDEYSHSIVISSFDPVRRLLAKEALGKLFLDGRISPNRIEEAVKHAQATIEASLDRIGEEAAQRAQVHSLHPELISLIGKLSTRMSFGQSVLEHSIEVSDIMAILAAELKLDVESARKIGFLHDIGKALPLENGLTHAIAGYNFALQHGEKKHIANGIGCHHDEMLPCCYEAALCKVADALSASRPGARQEPIEKHFQKLHSLESLAKSFEGVQSAYALQSGKEVRVLVLPEKIDDTQAILLAKKIAKKIENASPSTGKVQVTVVRETKVVEYACPQ